MKILHSISSIDKESGGTSTYLQLLANELAKHCSIEIATIHSKNPLKFQNHINIFYANTSFRNTHIFSKYFKHIVTPDLFHGNGLWQNPVHIMSRIALKRRIPYIISPHGMLEPWALNYRRLKKNIAMLMFQRNDLNNACCIHATAKKEAENIRKLGFTNPISVIPNGIDISEFPLIDLKSEKEKKTILFLSRIHPKKGIELLIEAWQKVDHSLKTNWQIEIAGNGEENYIASLQKLINVKGLEKEIQIIGPQFGLAKFNTYYRADLFVLPTYSENFGIVVAEALACGVPVITTKGTPWEELNICLAGWWIDIGVKPLVETLNLALSLNETERIKMGKNGRELVKEKYSIEAVAQQMIKLYKWVLKEGDKPEFMF